MKVFNFFLYSSSFCLAEAITDSTLCISRVVVLLPSRINCSCIDSSSALKEYRSFSQSDVRCFTSSISFFNLSCLSSKAINRSRLSTSEDFLRNLSLTFSRLRFNSSYLRTPRTSLYAEHKRFLSADVFVSARATICSESKKKKRAISLFRIKSLMNTSDPISAVNSFLTPSIRMSTDSFSVTMS